MTISTATAAIFDVHVELVLQNAWRCFGDPSNPAAQANFRTLWHGVRPELVDVWWAELSRKRPSFNPAAQPRTPREDAAEEPNMLPLVLVELDEEGSDTELLGRAGYKDQESGKEIKVSFHSQKVIITILSRSPELTRSLYVVMRDALFLAETDFIHEGYTSLNFISGGRLEPQEELLVEEQGVYGRRQVWECVAQLACTPTTAPAAEKGWFVATDNITVDGYAGGVDSSESF